MEPSIIFRDDSIVVLDKPSGLLVHAAGENSAEPTLADWLLKRFPEVRGIGEKGRWGIVHRLDRETSGIMIAAVTESAFARLKKQFARREVHKTYRAFVYGAMKDERGVIERAIGRSTSGNRSSKMPPDAEGKIRESKTTFKTLLSRPLASYLELYPTTGRTHQIRVHLSALQRPVVCDARYAPGRPAILGFHRCALHALKMSFVHPVAGQEMSFEASLPAEFLQAERLLKEELR